MTRNQRRKSSEIPSEVKLRKVVPDVPQNQGCHASGRPRPRPPEVQTRPPDVQTHPTIPRTLTLVAVVLADGEAVGRPLAATTDGRRGPTALRLPEGGPSVVGTRI
jgi:hypothetical protein